MQLVAVECYGMSGMAMEFPASFIADFLLTVQSNDIGPDPKSSVRKFSAQFHRAA